MKPDFTFSIHDEELDVKVLIGQVLERVENNNGESILFTAVGGVRYALYHDQDCCETVTVQDVDGNLNNLIGTPILRADVETSDQDPVGHKREYPPESMTWTYFRFETAKGKVVIRWLGESNGYYSESVQFVKLNAPEETPA